MGNIIKCITCGFEHDDSDPGCVICEPDKFPGPTAEDMLACELGAHRFFAGISRDGYAKEISGRILTAFRELRDERDALREDVEAQEKSTELRANINRWLKSDVGTKCQETGILSDQSYGQYLRHRLERAFLAGWNAAERDKKSVEQTKTPRHGAEAGGESA